MTTIRALTIAILAAAPILAQFGGPAMLSRGQAPTGMAGPQVSFRPFFQLNGLYDTGLSNVEVDSQGNLANKASYGLQLSGGISGAHRWSHTTLGLDYKGSISRYTSAKSYDQTDHSLMLGVTRQFTRHTSLSVRQSAGIFSRSFGLLGLPQTVPFDPATSFVPTTDFFDNRTIYSSTQADLTVQRSLRLSYNLGGDTFLARRRSSALYGVTGAGARADVLYRVSRRSTIGAGYTFTHFAFHGVFSSTDMHGVLASYGIQPTRRLEFTAMAGFMRAESKFLQLVALPPAIAALIGAGSATAVLHSIDYIPNVSGRLSRTFETGVAYLSAGRTITPGNGLFLTSEMTNATAGYSYTGLRRWSFNINGGYHRAKSISNVRGYYGGVNGSLSASRQITGSLHGVVSFSARQYQSRDFQGYNRLIYTARIGLGFSPGSIPLRIW